MAVIELELESIGLLLPLSDPFVLVFAVSLDWLRFSDYLEAFDLLFLLSEFELAEEEIVPVLFSLLFLISWIF